MVTKNNESNFEIKLGKGTVTFRWFVSVAFLVNIGFAIRDYNKGAEDSQTLSEIKTQMINFNSTMAIIQYKITAGIDRTTDQQKQIDGLRYDISEFKDKYYSHIRGIQ